MRKLILLAAVTVLLPSFLCAQTIEEKDTVKIREFSDLTQKTSLIWQDTSFEFAAYNTSKDSINDRVSIGAILRGISIFTDIIGPKQIDTTSSGVNGIASKDYVDNLIDDVSAVSSFASYTADGTDTINFASSALGVRRISTAAVDSVGLQFAGAVAGGQYTILFQNPSSVNIGFPSSALFPNGSQIGVRTLTDTVYTNLYYDGTNYVFNTTFGTAYSGSGGGGFVATYDYFYLSSEVVNRDSIQLSWSTNYDDVTSYDIQRSTDGTTFSNVSTGESGTTYYDVSHSENQLYYYRIRANRVSGTSYSNRSLKGAFLGYSQQVVADNNEIGEFLEIDTINNFSIHQDSVWSVEFWVETNSWDRGTYVYIQDIDNTGNKFRLWQSGGSSVDTFLIAAYETGSNSASTKDEYTMDWTTGSSPDIYAGNHPLNKMVHVVLTHSGNGDFRTGSQLYFDGQPIYRETETQDDATGDITGNLRLYAMYATKLKHGPIRLYQSELSESQVETLYNKGIPYYGDLSSLDPRLNFEYDADTKSNDTIYVADATINNNDAIIINSNVETVAFDSAYDDVIFDRNYKDIYLDSFLIVDVKGGYFHTDGRTGLMGPSALSQSKVYYYETSDGRKKTYIGFSDLPGIGGNKVSSVVFVDHEAQKLSPLARGYSLQTGIIDNHQYSPVIADKNDRVVTMQENRHNSKLYLRAFPNDLDSIFVDIDSLSTSFDNMAYPTFTKVGNKIIGLARDGHIDSLNRIAVFSTNYIDSTWIFNGHITLDENTRNYPILISSPDELILSIGHRTSGNRIDTVTIIKTTDGDTWTNAQETVSKTLSSNEFFTGQELIDSCYVIGTTSTSIDLGPITSSSDNAGNTYFLGIKNVDASQVNIFHYDSDSLKYAVKNSLTFTAADSKMVGYAMVNIGVDSFDLFVIEKRSGHNVIVQYRTTNGFSSVSEIGTIGDTSKDYNRLTCTFNSYDAEFVTIVANEFDDLTQEGEVRETKLFVYHYQKP